MGELVLLVEDDAAILGGNERMLRRRGYAVASARDLAGARAALAAGLAPDALVLDIRLPDGNGLDFLEDLRKVSDVPILLLTGLAAPADLVAGLGRGGDDYLAKPYDFDVLAARLAALLRRAGSLPGILRRGALSFDLAAGRAFLRGEDLLLTPKEFAVLLHLARREREAVGAGGLYESVWKAGPGGGGGSAVKTVVSRLRRKLGEGFIIECDQSEGGYVFTSLPE
jgi:DNA-binding response OmpR family regulator